MAVTIELRGNRKQQGFFRAVLVNDTGTFTSYLNTEGFFRPGITNNGMRFQATGAAVQVFYTLDDPERATRPEPAAQAGVTWTAVATDAAGAYMTDQGMLHCTAMKFIFNGKSSIAIGCN